MRRVWTVLVPVLGLACRFDPSGLNGDAGDLPGADGGTADGDGGGASDAPSWPDAAPPCPGDLFVAVQVNGVTPPGDPSTPAAIVLVGDTVTLTSAGSCVAVPPIRYSWTISPVDGTPATAAPSLAAPNITVYPVAASSYYVSLTVLDAMNRTATAPTFLAFRAVGFARLDGLAGNQDVRDLSAGDGVLYAATHDGAFSTPLAAPGAYTDLGATFGGSGPPADLGTVFHEPAAGAVWVGDVGSNSVVWRADLGTGVWEAVVYDAGLGGSATVRAIAGASVTGDVAVATARGVGVSAGGAAFTLEFDPAAGDEVWAFAAATARRWAGGAALWDPDDPTVELQPFGSGVGDQKIRALAVDEARGVLWVGSDASGVAAVELATGAPIKVYQGASGGLPSNKIRALAVETSGPFLGDVWAATDNGFARWKRDRDVMVPLGAAAGLTGRTNLGAAAFDGDGGRRAIYGGSSTGLVYISEP